MRPLLACLCLLALAPAAHAACPVGLVLSVDNDTPGSGYSEVKPENWVSHSVDACKGNYRYLSAYVGDGTRKGKAVWQPNVSVAGMYEVTTSFRATTNRTNDADYTLFDDLGGTQKKSVDQTKGDGCTKVVIGTAYCAVGGSCRLVLDGDDGKSDSADETVFVLKSCDTTAPDAGAPGPCDGITAVAAYELCEQTPTTCSGVYNDGAGCTKFCAAAGMICTARFGAGAGCSKEAQNPFACGANNGHQSNWCDCAYPPGSGGTGGGGSGGAAGGGGSAGTPPSGGAAGASGGWTGSGASIGKVDAGPDVQGGTTAEDDGGCGCRAGRGRERSLAGAVAALVALGLAARRRAFRAPD